MSVETWVKALTAMEAGVWPQLDEGGMFTLNYWWTGEKCRLTAEQMAELESRDTDREDYFECAAAACDALSLPWQQHPVWRMWEALQLTEQAVHTKWIGGAEGLAWAHGMKASPEDAALMAKAAQARKAALDAAKGGGKGV